MGKILGNIATTTTPRSDWAQTDRTKVDFILNKPDFDGLKAEVSNLAADVKIIDDALTEKIGYNEQILTEEQKAQVRENIGVTKSIIDVIELPAENIDESCFYRLLSAKFIMCGKEVTNSSVCYCVNNIPESGDAVTSDMNIFIAYYNVTDNEVYGYVDSVLASAFSISAGWYPFSALAQISGLGFNGVATDINDLPTDNNYFGILLTKDFYIYQDGWCKIPFAYESTPEFDITWDGVIGDRFALDITSLGYPNSYYVKITNDVFTQEQLIGATYTQYIGYEHTVEESSFDATTYPGMTIVDAGVVIVHSADDLNTALGLPAGYITNGTYFVLVEDNYTNRLVGPTKITKIDEKYLPEVDANSLGLSEVAISGNYYDLYNIPTIYNDVVRWSVSQSLSTSNKATARKNIDVYSKAEVDAKIGSGIDLSSYATKEYVDSLIESAIGGSY